MSFISENFGDAIIHDDDYDPRDFDEADEIDEDICPNCNGSGEGMYDGSRCHVCKGSGEV